MNNTPARDLFDELADDPFDNVSSTEDDALEKIKNDLSSLIEKLDTKDRKKQNGELVNEVKNLVKAELSKIKPVQNVIERQVQQVVKHVQVPVHIPPPPPPKIIERPAQIIREVRVEVPAKDPKKYAEEKIVDQLKADLAELKDKYDRVVETLPMIGGSGVIGVPPPEGHEGQFLKVINGKWSYEVATGGTITRSGNFISSVSLNSGKTITVTRDRNNYISTVFDGRNTWSFTRDGSNRLTSWTVS